MLCGCAVGHVVDVEGYRALGFVRPVDGLLNRHIVSPFMIDHGKRGYLLRLIGIDTAIIVLCGFNDGVHPLPPIRARPVIDNIPDHEICALCRASRMIQRGMSRSGLTDFEWRAIEPIVPKKPSGVPRVDDRCVLNGVFWVLRSGAPWRHVPERYGPIQPATIAFDAG